MTTPPTLPTRYAELVFARPDGVLLRLPPVPVATPWWQDAAPVVRAISETYGIDVAILRLLSTERAQPHGGHVVYLAETGAPPPAAAVPWDGTLDDHPLRLPYARAGGPGADLSWAREVLAGHGLAPSGAPEQARTWNLSSLWRLPTGGGDVWLKAVPAFFAHEGPLLAALQGGPVPRVLGHGQGRTLMAHVPGEDMYEAGLDDRLAMVDALVGLQRAWTGRTGEALALGLPDWRAGPLGRAIEDVVARTAPELDAADVAVLDPFVADLPRRFGEVAACGLPDTLVHGDFHPGNVRGIYGVGAGSLTLIDWGDAGIGHPLLDMPAFLAVAGEDATAILAHWLGLWRDAMPGADPDRARALLSPVAAARQAVIYRRFLDGIEPSERIYHRADPADWLRRTAGVLRAGT